MVLALKSLKKWTGIEFEFYSKHLTKYIKDKEIPKGWRKEGPKRFWWEWCKIFPKWDEDIPKETTPVKVIWGYPPQRSASCGKTRVNPGLFGKYRYPTGYEKSKDGKRKDSGCPCDDERNRRPPMKTSEVSLEEATQIVDRWLEEVFGDVQSL